MSEVGLQDLEGELGGGIKSECERLDEWRDRCVNEFILSSQESSVGPIVKPMIDVAGCLVKQSLGE